MTIARGRRAAVIVVATPLIRRWIGRRSGVRLRLERRKIRRLLLGWRRGLLARRRIAVDGIWRSIPRVGRVSTSWGSRRRAITAGVVNGREGDRGGHACWRGLRRPLRVVLGRWRVVRLRSGLVLLGATVLRILLSIAVVGHATLMRKGPLTGRFR